MPGVQSVRVAAAVVVVVVEVPTAMLQLKPPKPGTHAQVAKLRPIGMHVPPFRHAFGVHNVIVWRLASLEHSASPVKKRMAANARK